MKPLNPKISLDLILPLRNFLLVCVPALFLAGCGGGDTADRLDLANPAVRFVHASPSAPSLTLYRNAAAQPDASNVAYKFAANYADIDTNAAVWAVKTAVGGAPVGTVAIDPVRGNKYTIVALPSTFADNTVVLITDPYNKPLTSDSTRLRLMNAAYNAPSVDVYMNAVGTDIAAAGVNPLIAATAFKTAGPASGSDSVSIPAGTYQLAITAAGTKTMLFKGTLNFGANKDILLLGVPGDIPINVPGGNPPAPNGIKVLAKTEGTVGAVDVPAL